MTFPSKMWQIMTVSKVEITSRSIQKDGVSFEIRVRENTLKVILTNHALERIERWRLKEIEVLAALFFAEEVVIGHGNRFIAHKSRNKHIIRIIYEYQNDIPKVITVYAPIKARYFQGGGKYANKILP